MGLTLSLWSLDLSRTNRWTSLVVGFAEDCSLDIIVALETLLVLCDNGWEGCYHPGEAQAGHHLGDLWAAPSSQHFSHCHRTQHQRHHLYHIQLHFLHVSREWAGWVKCIESRELDRDGARVQLKSILIDIFICSARQCGDVHAV